MAITEQRVSINTSPLAPIDNALRKIFSTSEEESNIQRARRIMGVLAQDITDEELEVYITELQYVIDEWFDTFERQVFVGETLKQVLGQA